MPRPPRAFRLAVLLFCMLLSSAVSAATISGRITDASTGKPMVFATVRILELSNEVHTDADGQYVFEGIPAGRYTIAVTFAGYADYAIGIVETQMEGRKTLDAALQPDIAPMYERDTEPEGLLSDDESHADNTIHDNPIRLSDMPIRGYEDYVAIQAGTVRRFYGAPVHVRGGRIEEFGYDVDGFPQQDPFTGRSFTAINGNTIADIQFHPGYSDPSHGWLASGRAEIKTRETWSTGGSFEAITDNFHGEKSDYNLYALDLSGPLLAKTPGQLTYAVAGEYRTFGNRVPGGPGDWNYLGAWHANLRWRPCERTSTLIGTRGSYEDWKYTPREWYFNSVHSPRGVDENYSVFGKLEHDIARRTKLSASANWFSVSHQQGDGLHFDDLWTYGRPSGNPNFDGTQLFTAWDDIYLDQDSLAEGHYFTLRTPVVESTYTVELPNGESVQQSFTKRGDEGTVWDDYYKQKGSYVGGSLGIAHVHSSDLRSRIGFDFQRHTTRAYRNLFPVNVHQGTEGGFDDIDRYGYDELGNESEDDINGAKHPTFLAAHINEQLVLRDLTLNVGVRWDRFDYQTTGLVDPSQPLDPFDRAAYADTASGLSDDERNDLRQGAHELEPDELTEVDPINRLSPRLLARVPLGSSGSLHFGIGKYVQRSPFEHIYADFNFLEYKVRTGGYSYAFGNSRIEPTSVVLYEAGVQVLLGSILEVGTSVYYKNVSGRTGIRDQPARPNNFAYYDNLGDATIKGVQLDASMRRMSGLAVSVQYTLASSEETGNLFDVPDNVSWTNVPPRPVTAPSWHDQRHRIVAIADLRSGPTGGPAIGEWRPLSNTGVSILTEIGSGFPYTPAQASSELFLGFQSFAVPVGPINSERSDWTYRIDMKVNKWIPVKGAELELYLWIVNLLAKENVVDVYDGTGQPDNTGWLDTPDGQQFIQHNSSIHDSSFLTGEQKYELRQNDPANFDIPRQIRFGMRVGF